jgi:hypothetical protein
MFECHVEKESHMRLSRPRLVGCVALGVISMLTCFPSVSAAQSAGTIAGAVRDSTGAVLPGVTVEATSPALIEKVRTAVTDEQGNYKIVDLRPGVYTVAFTLTGFSSLKREGIELSAGFTATVNADLSVGAVAETLTVSGATPIVDVQNATQQTVLSRTVVDTLPAGRAFYDLAVLVPGVTTTHQDVGGGAVYPASLAVHGSRPGEMPSLLDGLRYNNASYLSGGGATLYRVNPVTIEELIIEVSGTSAEIDVSGVRANIIPKNGGNDVHGTAYTNYTNHDFQGSNLTPALKAQVGSVPQLQQSVDAGSGIGGPIKRDALWYFVSARREYYTELAPGAFHNANGPQAILYTPDLSNPGENKNQY